MKTKKSCGRLSWVPPLITTLFFISLCVGLASPSDVEVLNIRVKDSWPNRRQLRNRSFLIEMTNEYTEKSQFQNQYERRTHKHAKSLKSKSAKSKSAKAKSAKSKKTSHHSEKYFMHDKESKGLGKSAKHEKGKSWKSKSFKSKSWKGKSWKHNSWKGKSWKSKSWKGESWNSKSWKGKSDKSISYSKKSSKSEDAEMKNGDLDATPTASPTNVDDAGSIESPMKESVISSGFERTHVESHDARNSSTALSPEEFNLEYNATMGPELNLGNSSLDFDATLNSTNYGVRDKSNNITALNETSPEAIKGIQENFSKKSSGGDSITSSESIIVEDINELEVNEYLGEDEMVNDEAEEALE